MEENVSLTPASVPTPQPPTFVGNSNDVLAVVAATIAGTTGLCCLTWGYGIYCLPVVAVTLGAAALLNAKASVNPERTKRWAWVSVGVGGGVLLVLCLFAAAIAFFYGAIIAATLSGAFPTATPTRFR
ncbi:MAG: hypothetical protein HY782_20690 [Chloroflexi bacterium]|nr:hypothetical protein [Chloroflexota bacterium]